MLENEEEWAAIIDSFQEAALGTGSWDEALRGFARATGSRATQLTALAGSTVLFNILPDIDPTIHEAFARSLTLNPRIPVVTRAPVLEVIADCDIVTPEELHKSRFYHEVTGPFDIPYVCLTNLEKSTEAFIGLAAVRAERQGHITRAEREIFTKLAPHVRSAVRMQLALEHQGTELAMGMMGSLSIAAMLCDRYGRVRAVTPPGEELLLTRPELKFVKGNLGAVRPKDAKVLSDAIEAAARATREPGPPVLNTIALSPLQEGTPPLVLDVFALHTRQTFELWRFSPRVLIVARGPRGTELQKGAILKAVYGLTPAECEIALKLALGRNPEMIAEERAATVGTVRQQVKSVLLKLGLSKQLEIAALIARL